jgi:nitrogen regulatory protein PII 2
MTEITAIIRMNKINQTKEALIQAGFPAATAMRALGRGRRPIEFDVLNAINENPRESADILPTLARGGRLYGKRLIFLVVPDGKAAEVIQTIIKVNQTGNPGDGKIFVSPVTDVVRVRTGDTGPAAIDEMNGSEGS